MRHAVHWTLLGATLALSLALLTLATGAVADEGPVTLEWDDLLPEDFRPEVLFADLGDDFYDLDDEDPRAIEIMAKIQELFDAAPTVDSWENRLVRLPGFVVPLEGDGRSVSEFLLVPYFGACIHVPPPPANQIVYIKTRDGKPVATRGMFDTVWVTGVMQTERTENELGTSGYLIEATLVEPYDE